MTCVDRRPHEVGPALACDMPEADAFRLHIKAGIAEDQRRRISARTKSALQAAKAMGVKLGGFRGSMPNADEIARGRQRGRATRNQMAQQRADSLSIIITDLKAEGVVSEAAIAKALRAKGYRYTTMQVELAPYTGQAPTSEATGSHVSGVRLRLTV